MINLISVSTLKIRTILICLTVNFCLFFFLACPEFHATEQRFEAPLGSSLEVPLRLTANPSPTVVCLSHNDLDINNPSVNIKTEPLVSLGSREYSTRLTSQTLSRKDAGLYVCTAKNLAGVATMNLTVVILTEPASPHGLRAFPAPTNNRSLTINWLPTPVDGHDQFLRIPQPLYEISYSSRANNYTNVIAVHDLPANGTDFTLCFGKKVKTCSLS